MCNKQLNYICRQCREDPPGLESAIQQPSLHLSSQVPMAFCIWLVSILYLALIHFCLKRCERSPRSRPALHPVVEWSNLSISANRWRRKLFSLTKSSELENNGADIPTYIFLPVHIELSCERQSSPPQDHAGVSLLHRKLTLGCCSTWVLSSLAAWSPWSPTKIIIFFHFNNGQKGRGGLFLICCTLSTATRIAQFGSLITRQWCLRSGV